MIPIFEKAHQLDLTGTEEEILQYFESNLPASIYTSLNDLSASLYTSNATIVRFCQKLGLKGYNEFKYQVRGELKQLHMTPTSDDLMHHTLALFRDNLEQIDVAKLEEIAGLLTSGRPIYIYGSNLSSLSAKYLQTVLTSLDYPCILIEWQRLLTGLPMNSAATPCSSSSRPMGMPDVTSPCSKGPGTGEPPRSCLPARRTAP